jgi:hypothetical protein
MGFSAGECAVYASLVFAAATLLGISLGLVSGHYIGKMLLPAAEGATMYFVHTSDPLTYVFAAAITAGCALHANGAALAELIGQRISDHQKESAA